MQRITPVVLNLIIINVLVWIAQLMLDKTIGFTNYLALFPLDSGGFKPYQLITYMFAHASYDLYGNVEFFHILFNMYALWMFGSALEHYWGPKRFIIFYLICGVAAGVAQLFLAKGGAVGASGSIMGLLAAFAYLFPNTSVYMLS